MRAAARRAALTAGVAMALAVAGAAGGCADSGTGFGKGGTGAAGGGAGTGTGTGTGTGAGGAAGSCDPTHPTAGTRTLRRLTSFEYDNTLQDLLGVPPQYGALFPADDVVHNFDDNAAALHVAPLYTDTARQAAEAVAASVKLDSLVPCPVASGTDACATSFLSSFGLQAFRRPLTSAEQQRYLTLHQAVTATDGFEGGVRAVLTAMLQSPSFLYRTEVGAPDAQGGYTLTPYEIASELSYLFTGSMPDAALLKDAASGALAGKDVIASHAKRLLASPKSKVLLQHFAEQWLELRHLDLAVKDATSFPAFTPALRDAMHAETVAYFTNTLASSTATFADLLTGTTTWASPALAQFYGLGAPAGPADASGLAPYALTGGRVGLLTQGSVLAAQAKADRTSPVLRGKLVREQLFCQELPPPPPGVNTQIPPPSPDASTRELFTAHSTDPACAGCHKLMDPVGFGFEAFDGIGAPVAGGVDVSGNIYGTASSNGAFVGVADLAAHLAKSADAQACFAVEWYRFGYGLDEATDTSCVGPALAQAFTQGQSLQGLLIALTQTDHFVRRDADAPGAAAPEAGVAGGDDASNAPAPTPSTDAAPPPADAAAPASNVQVSVQTTSSWQGGYCDNVTVTNPTSASIAWTASVPPKGTIYNSWNCVAQTSGPSWTFTGAPGNNDQLAAGASTTFGFCAND